MTLDSPARTERLYNDKNDGWRSPRPAKRIIRTPRGANRRIAALRLGRCPLGTASEYGPCSVDFGAKEAIRLRHQFEDLEVSGRRVGSSEPSAHLAIPHHHDRAAQCYQFFKCVSDENDTDSVLRKLAD